MDQLVFEFAKSMDCELKANLHKGDWRNWDDIREMFMELEYHKGKLLKAMKNQDMELIKEYLADCGNFLMFIGNAYNLYDSVPEEKILCAAIWYKDFEMPKHANQVKNIDKGVVLCGHRHGHVISQLIAISGKRTCTFGDNAAGESVQGFLTNRNRFIDRKEAHELFIKNGGQPEFKEELYSEDLY